MKEVGNIINVTYGRVESTAIEITKPASDWDKIVAEKVKKGYKDVTSLIAVASVAKVADKLVASGDVQVDTFLALMEKYTKNLVKNTYSVKADAVTQQQVDDAQGLIDGLVRIDPKQVKTQETLINKILLDLYTTIPRYMGKVQQHLLPNINLTKTIEQEQDNLDAMAQQVAMFKPVKSAKKSTTLQDKLGIKMTQISDFKPVHHITKQLKSNKVAAVYQVDKPSENKVFDDWVSKAKNKETRLLIHGTRCTSVLPILEQGLKIRPVGNFQFSGKAYGDGNYFSEVTQKSLGYTGYDSDIILFVYEVHTGNPFKYAGWYKGNSFTLSYKELSKRGFDSTHVSAGNGLLNSEIIAYREEQCRVKYIIHIKR